MDPQHLERLVRLEANDAALTKQIKDLDVKVTDLLAIANKGIGKGIAFKHILQWGGFLLGLAAILNYLKH